jgi:ribonuclease P protein component
MDTEGAGTRGFRLPRALRITQSGEIRALFRRGKRRKTRHLDAFISPSPSAFARWGVVVPKHRHDIVERNQVKRRLREIGRTLVLPALGNSGRTLDVLIRARPEAYDASFDQLRGELQALTEELCSSAS